MKEKVLKFIHVSVKAKSIFFSFLFVFGIPIIFSFILGYQMQAHQIQQVPTVIVDHDNSQFSQMLVNEIKTNEAFNITNYSDNDEDVKNLIAQEKVRVGVIIPKGFSKDLASGNAPKVLVFYDGTQMTFVSSTKGRMDEILLTIKTGYLKKVVEGKLGVMPETSLNYVLPMYFNYRLLNNPTRNYMNFLIPGMIIAIVQVALVMFGVDIVKGDEKKYSWLWIKGIIAGLLGVISMGISLGILIKYFGVPFRGTVNGAVILTILYCIGLVNFGMFVRIALPDKILSIQGAAILVLMTTILSGFTFPLFAMPPFYQELAKFLPFYYYGETMRDLTMKNLGIQYILPQINWMIKFVLCMWAASFGAFQLKKIIKKIYTNMKCNKNHQQKAEEVIQG